MPSRPRIFSLVLILTLLSAACSSSEADPSTASVDSTSTTDSQNPAPGAETGTITSDDGVLTVTAPAGSGPITIDGANPIEELSGIGESLHAWELGPDGSTFTEAVELRFSVSADDLADGLFAASRSTDGTLEAIELTLEGGDDSFELVGEISHFTRIELRNGAALDVILNAPAEAEVDSSFDFWLSLTTGETEGLTQTPDRGGLKADETFITAGRRGRATCIDEGTGSVRFEGALSIESTWLSPDAIRAIPEWGGFGFINVSKAVNCVKLGKELPPEDQQCIDRNTGESAEDCLNPEKVSISTGTDGTAILDIGFDGAPADTDVTLELVVNDGDELIVVDCSNVQGCTIFYGPGFADVDSDLEFDSTTSDTGSVKFSGGPLSRSDSGELILNLPAGITSDGSEVTAGPRNVDELVIYTERASADSSTTLQGINTYPVTNLQP